MAEGLTPRSKGIAQAPTPSTPHTPSALPNRFQMMDSQLESGKKQSQVRKEREKKRLEDLHDRIETMNRMQEAQKKEILQDEKMRERKMESRILDLETELRKLRNDLATEEHSRRSTGNTFAQQFAMQIEERFVKAESTVAVLRKTVQSLKESLDILTKNVNDRFDDLEKRQEINRKQMAQRLQQLEDSYRNASRALVRIEKAVDDVNVNERRFESSLTEKTNRELSLAKEQMENDRLKIESLYHDAKQTAAEAENSVRQGKGSWMSEMMERLDGRSELLRKEFSDRVNATENTFNEKTNDLEKGTSDVIQTVESLRTDAEGWNEGRKNDISGVTEQLNESNVDTKNDVDALAELLEKTIGRIDEFERFD